MDRVLEQGWCFWVSLGVGFGFYVGFTSERAGDDSSWVVSLAFGVVFFVMLSILDLIVWKLLHLWKGTSK